MDIESALVGRQPIYGPTMDVLGYELLFRNGESNHAVFSSGEQATADVIVNSLMDIGLAEIIGSHLAFINFERNMIVQDMCESLPPERVILEVLETIDPEDAVVIQK